MKKTQAAAASSIRWKVDNMVEPELCRCQSDHERNCCGQGGQRLFGDEERGERKERGLAGVKRARAVGGNRQRA